MNSVGQLFLKLRDFPRHHLF